MSESPINPDPANPGPVELEHRQSSRPDWRRAALFFVPAAIGLLVDLVTKSYMFAHYFDPSRVSEIPKNNFAQTPVPIWEPYLSIQTSTNPGALFGIGAGYHWLFAIFSLLALVGIVSWLTCFGGWRDKWLTATLGLISGGILGNLYDRIGWGFTVTHPEMIRYHVRDWIRFEVEGVPMLNPWPNFNIADSCLVVGAAMLFIHAIWFSAPQGQHDESTEAKPAA